MEGEQKIVKEIEEEADGVQGRIDEQRKQMKELLAQLTDEKEQVKALMKKKNSPRLWEVSVEENAYEQAKKVQAFYMVQIRKIYDERKENTIGASSSQKGDELSPTMEGHKAGDAEA